MILKGFLFMRMWKFNLERKDCSMLEIVFYDQFYAKLFHISFDTGYYIRLLSLELDATFKMC